MPIDRPNVSAHGRADGMPLRIAWRQLVKACVRLGTAQRLCVSHHRMLAPLTWSNMAISQAAYKIPDITLTRHAAAARKQSSYTCIRVVPHGCMCSPLYMFPLITSVFSL